MGQSRKHASAANPADDHCDILRHELANTLNGLAGMTGLLRTSGLAPDQERWVDVIEQSAAQMNFLVGSPGAGQTGWNKAKAKTINGTSLLEQVVTAHTPAARSKGIPLFLSLTVELSDYWLVDRFLLRQLLDNLVNNALKFTEKGEVVVSARPEGKRGLCLSVSDTGPGVEAGELNRLFRAYERGNSKADQPGSGLGLFVCRSITRALGGEILCAPVPGEGAEFTVILPDVLDLHYQNRVVPTGLASVHCHLDLNGSLAKVTGNFLERLGVSWSPGLSGTRKSTEKCLNILVSSDDRRVKTGSPALLLREAGKSTINQAVSLPAPILQSTLETALLRLALAWRWERISPGGMRG